MQAYHNDEAVKAKYLARVRAHRAADELIKGATEGKTREGFRGCAVVCTVERYNHARYEVELGIPYRIARLEDAMFERMPNTVSQLWPERFLEAIPVGADLSQVVNRFIHWLLVDPEEGVIRHAKLEETKAIIAKVGDRYARMINGELTDSGLSLAEWREIRSRAWRAYYSSDAADADAADAADAAAAAADAADAADADAVAAAAAADAVAAAAAAAAAADAVAVAAAAAGRWRRDPNWQEFYAQRTVRQSEKLLELLRNAPVPAVV